MVEKPARSGHKYVNACKYRLSVNQGPIYWKTPPPLGGEEKLSADVIWGRNMKRRREIGGKYKRKRKKMGQKKEEKGKNEKRGSKW